MANAVSGTLNCGNGGTVYFWNPSGQPIYLSMDSYCPIVIPRDTGLSLSCSGASVPWASRNSTCTGNGLSTVVPSVYVGDKWGIGSTSLGPGGLVTSDFLLGLAGIVCAYLIVRAFSR